MLTIGALPMTLPLRMMSAIALSVGKSWRNP
jgi:hypothetical protein